MNDPVWIFAEQRVTQSPVDAREALTLNVDPLRVSLKPDNVFASIL